MEKKQNFIHMSITVTSLTLALASECLSQLCPAFPLSHYDQASSNCTCLSLQKIDSLKKHLQARTLLTSVSFPFFVFTIFSSFSPGSPC